MEESVRIAEAIRSGLPPHLSEEILLANMRKFSDKSSGGVLQAMRRAETMALTKQEKALIDVLMKAEIPYIQHATLSTKIGQLNVDFLVLGRLVIECTSSRSKWKAESLGFRAIKIKESHPNLKLMAVVPSDVDDGFTRRLIDFNFVVHDDNIKSLFALI
ncbi:MAG: hypothetical protein H3Z54_07465 [archaeon]|nr:hypothetical protein [archaeon]